jgi:uncharacterized protein YfcZ (UPF0381/DUF406 family)
MNWINPMSKENGSTKIYLNNKILNCGNTKTSNTRVYEEIDSTSTEKNKNVSSSPRTIMTTLTEVGSNAALNFLFAFFRRAWQSG